jgi:type IV fimbrial biogenesis protein FimT
MCALLMQFPTTYAATGARSMLAQHGFGMIETLIVLSVMAIAALWAVPVIERASARMRVDAGMREWVALLERARDQTLRTGSVVALCASRVVDARANASAPAPDRPCDPVEPAQACGNDGRVSGARTPETQYGEWECARLVALTHDRFPIEILQAILPDRHVAILGEDHALVFVPPLGRIAGWGRHFDVTPRATSRTREFEPGHCIRIAASGRVRVEGVSCDAF